MTFHKTRAKRATGSLAQGKSPRIVVCLPPEDMALAAWWAGVKGIPLAQVIRDSVHVYLSPFKNNPELKRQYGSQPKGTA
jgi:hypothetical protein